MPLCPRCHQPCPTRWTPRQREVLALFMRGQRAGEIADVLCLSPKTVESHLAHARQQLALPTSRALLVYLWTHNLGAVLRPPSDAGEVAPVYLVL